MLHAVLDAVVVKMKLSPCESYRNSCEKKYAAEPTRKRLSKSLNIFDMGGFLDRVSES
jgi:hypothetical protein